MTETPEQKTARIAGRERFERRTREASSSPDVVVMDLELNKKRRMREVLADTADKKFGDLTLKELSDMQIGLLRQRPDAVTGQFHFRGKFYGLGLSDVRMLVRAKLDTPTTPDDGPKDWSDVLGDEPQPSDQSLKKR
ncbi:MAG TPA: hypothetical protein VM013_05985 [Dehalococcoidia bacterium]|nr:hypothetical protein [Dehalococcoidia bacterium]